MSNALENMKTRRSVRKYKNEMIAPDVLEQILQAGTWAATGRNLQSPIMVAVTNRELRDRLSQMNAAIMGVDTDPFYGAPVVVIVLANRDVPTHVYDGSLVMGNLMLAAHELGVGSCWIHRAREEFETEEGKALLREIGIEGDYVGIGHCILGYPDGPLPPAKVYKENYIYYVK